MKADYKNWVPKYMVNGLIAGTIVFAVLFVIFGIIGLGLSGVLRVDNIRCAADCLDWHRYVLKMECYGLQSIFV